MFQGLGCLYRFHVLEFRAYSVSGFRGQELFRVSSLDTALQPSKSWIVSIVELHLDPLHPKP